MKSGKLIRYIKNDKYFVKKVNEFNLKYILNDIFYISNSEFSVHLEVLHGVEFINFENITFFDDVCTSLGLYDNFLDNLIYDKFSHYQWNLDFYLGNTMVIFNNCKFHNKLFIDGGYVQIDKPKLDSVDSNFEIIARNMKEVQVGLCKEYNKDIDTIYFDVVSDRFILDASDVKFRLMVDSANASLFHADNTDQIILNGQEVKLSNKYKTRYLIKSKENHNDN